VLLAASTVLALVADGGGERPWVTVGAVLLAVGWIRLVPAGPVHVAGLIVLIGVVCAQSVGFASFFAFIGYLRSWQDLKGAWRFAGVTATALISVAGFFGGLPGPEPSSILTFVFLTAAIVAGVSLFSFVGEITSARSAERQQMVAKLEEALKENAGLHAQLLIQAREAGVMDERQRMAAEIHDTLAQGLTGIITQLQAARRAEDWQRYLDNAERLARESLAEARRSVHAVGPGQLDAAPLPEALREVADRWGELNGVPVTFTVTGAARPLHPEVEETLLRTAQEALANTAKHAAASRVGLTLSYMEDMVTLDVRDDGAGFDPERVRDGGGFGLMSMRKRVARLAGTLEIESEPGGGTAVSASVPAVARD